MTIPVPQRINNQLSENFYPLQREELIKLREVKLINNAAYVHLALRYENPFCDRPVQIIPKEFALRWRIPEVSVYKAIAKLKELGILNIKSGKLVIDWVIKSENQVLKDTASHNTETATEDIAVNDFSNSTKNYQIEEKIIRSDNELSNPKTDYQIRENRTLKPLSDISSSISQTVQTYSDFKDSLSEDERENFFNFVQEKTNNLERPINDLEAWLASKNAAKQNRWEIYYRSYQEERINEIHKTTRHSENGGKLSPSKMQQAIAEFKKQRQINQPVDEPENVNSDGRLSGGNLPIQNTTEEYRHSAAEINKLLDNPPERENSLAQTHRERIAEVKRQQAEIRRANREAAESRAKQQNSDPEPRKLETLRQIEEMNQLQSSQNSDLDEEDGSNE
jgi:antitoxin component HigA of HigAB toxin-antitoxin module